MKTEKAQKKSIGLRLDASEEAFLAGLTDKKTSVDGLRLLISRAVQEKTPPKSLEEAYARLSAKVSGAVSVFHEPPRSVVCEDILRECLMLLSTISVGVPEQSTEGQSGDDLASEKHQKTLNACKDAFEAKIIDRAFDLTDTLLRHALTDSAAARSPKAVRQRLVGSRSLMVSCLHAFAKDNPVGSEEVS